MQNHRAEITKDNIDPRARYRHPNGTEAPGIDRRTSAPSSTQGSRFESQQPHMDSGTAHTGDVSTWDCGSSLYDSFELVSLFNQLDRGLAPLHPSAIPADEINKSSDHKTKRLNISHAFRFCASPSNLCLENDFGTNYMNCECKKKKKKNPFRWLLRLSLSISHVLALWVDDERCPIHGHRIGQINDRDFCSLTEKKKTDYCSREYEQKSSPTAEDLVLPSG